MTTLLRDTYRSGDSVTIQKQPTSASMVRLYSKHMESDCINVVDRAEFLAAVSAELGVLIINRDDLPQVTGGVEYGDGYSIGSEHYEQTTATEARDEALRWLALAEHLAANPAVDKDQVNALTAILAQATSDPDDIDIPDVARRLVRAGVRAPEEAGR